MIEYCKGCLNEFEDITDFINMVFSMHKKPHNFMEMLPKLYSSNQNTANFHYLAKENGKIKAVICVNPIHLKFQDQLISCATVGSVSVHPNSRGQGYMKKLMAMALEDMEKEQITMSILSGRRHRYQYYGYELGGHSIEYQFIQDNFKHSKSMFPFIPLTLTEISRTDTELISELHGIFEQQKVHGIRPLEAFYDIITSWYSKIYVISDAKKVVGYLSAHHDTIREVVLIDDRLLYSVLDAYLLMCSYEKITLTIPPYEIDKITALSSLYETWNVSFEDNYRIFDFKRALQFFLSIKHSYQPLTEGELVLEIKNRCNLKIAVTKAHVTVKDSIEIANCSLTEFEAVSILFSPISPYFINPEENQFRNNWFPLPLSISSLDKC